jgi:hypothetical protein
MASLSNVYQIAARTKRKKTGCIPCEFLKPVVFFVLLKSLALFVLNTWIVQLMFCPCCVLACCVHAPCVWLPFYSEGTSIIANPWIAVDGWRCSNLSPSN